jgi:hypothetical protein
MKLKEERKKERKNIHLAAGFCILSALVDWCDVSFRFWFAWFVATTVIDGSSFVDVVFAKLRFDFIFSGFMPGETSCGLN